ncbi:MAG: hypothetical protein KA109_12680 [Saprospiraceae bacterium]|nr:hypothetical protein [Saprospiraceae bacterium]MBP8096226.1 hypothetical protein [Saprospiraceae bacterium]
MANFKIEPEDYIKVNYDCCEYTALKKIKFDSFNESILGIGDVSSKSLRINSIAVIFDLESFTTFSSQSDPQLFLPDFLNDFLKWIFNGIKIKNKIPDLDFPDGIVMYSTLPYYSKFLGDGVLFLFETNNLDEDQFHNIIAQMSEITKEYKSKKLPSLERNFPKVPRSLRCGIAAGDVYSIGNGKDYVGPCINTAARLQHWDSYTFAFSLKGIKSEKLGKNPDLFHILIDQDIRGIGESQIVGVLREEFERHIQSKDLQMNNDNLNSSVKIFKTKDSFSKCEEIIILSATQAKNDQIIKAGAGSHLKIEINGVSLIGARDGRSIAEWEDAFINLINKEILRKSGQHSYSFTSKGYEVGDILKSNTNNTPA